MNAKKLLPLFLMSFLVSTLSAQQEMLVNNNFLCAECDDATMAEKFYHDSPIPGAGDNKLIKWPKHWTFGGTSFLNAGAPVFNFNPQNFGFEFKASPKPAVPGTTDFYYEAFQLVQLGAGTYQLAATGAVAEWQEGELFFIVVSTGLGKEVKRMPLPLSPGENYTKDFSLFPLDGGKFEFQLPNGTYKVALQFANGNNVAGEGWAGATFQKISMLKIEGDEYDPGDDPYTTSYKEVVVCNAIAADNFIRVKSSEEIRSVKLLTVDGMLCGVAHQVNGYECTIDRPAHKGIFCVLVETAKGTRVTKVML